MTDLTPPDDHRPPPGPPGGDGRPDGDLTHPNTDEVASAVLDGEATEAERAAVDVDPSLQARVAQFAAVQQAVAGDVVVDLDVREAAIARALEADDAPGGTGEADVDDRPVPFRRRRGRNTAIGLAVAGVAATLVLVLWLSRGTSSSVDTFATAAAGTSSTSRAGSGGQDPAAADRRPAPAAAAPAAPDRRAGAGAAASSTPATGPPTTTPPAAGGGGIVPGASTTTTAPPGTKARATPPPVYGGDLGAAADDEALRQLVRTRLAGGEVAADESAAGTATAPPALSVCAARMATDHQIPAPALLAGATLAGRPVYVFAVTGSSSSTTATRLIVTSTACELLSSSPL